MKSIKILEFWKYSSYFVNSLLFKMRFQNSPIETNTLFFVRYFDWGFTAPWTAFIWTLFRGNLMATLDCWPVISNSGMLNLNILSVFWFDACLLHFQANFLSIFVSTGAVTNSYDLVTHCCGLWQHSCIILSSYRQRITGCFARKWLNVWFNSQKLVYFCVLQV